MGAIVKRGTKEKPRFYLRFVDLDGTRRMIKAKGATRRDEARAMLNTIERNILEGRLGVPKPAEPDPEAEKRATITIEQLGEKFTEEFTAPRIKNPADYRMEAKSVLSVRVYPTLGARPAAAVTPLDVEQLRDVLAEEYAAQSVTNTLNTLSKVYGWAQKQNLIDCANPCKGVERHKSEALEPIDSDKYLSKQEVAALLAYVDDLAVPGVASEATIIARPMIYTAAYAGLRKGELFGLRWSSVDLDRLQLEVARSYDGKTKSGKTRHVPISPKLAPILRAWKKVCPKTAGNLVFPVEERMGEAYETLGLGELLVSAGCHEPPKVWHGLRHTFAAQLVMSGANILTVQRLLGHAKIETTLIYAHLAPDFIAAEVARLSFEVAIAGVTPISEAATAAASA